MLWECLEVSPKLTESDFSFRGQNSIAFLEYKREIMNLYEENRGPNIHDIEMKPKLLIRNAFERKIRNYAPDILVLCLLEVD